MFMKFDRIYLHIGTHKTGTTTIQELYFENRKLIAEEVGIFYPCLDSNHGNFLRLVFEQEEGATLRAWFPSELSMPSQEVRDSTLKKLEKELDDTKCRQALFSGEWLSLMRPEEIHAFRNWLLTYTQDIVVLTFVRNPRDWFESSISQIMKYGMTLDESVARISRRVGFKELIGRWRDAFGAENVRVFDMDGLKKEPGGLLGGFHAELGISSDTLMKCSLNAVERNRRVSQEYVALIDGIHRGFRRERAEPEKSPINYKNLQRLLAIQGVKFRLSIAHRRQLEDKIREQLEWLESEFGFQYDGWEESNSDQPSDCGKKGVCFSELGITTMSELVSNLLIENQHLESLSSESKGFVRKVAALKEEVATMKSRLTRARLETVESWSLLYRLLRPVFRLEKSLRKRMGS